ncbi:MAG: COX15/CtaA family protein [Rhodoferax sp.]
MGDTLDYYNLAPVASLLMLAAALAALVWALWWWRQRRPGGAQGVHALAVLSLFLAFDLVVFGAFTRLTDSGLGCPDWPGCYGHTSPVGARGAIAQAEQLAPLGPVTQSKAWIEMVHRYWAGAVGALIVAQAWVAWRRRRVMDWRVPALTLLWVCLQGAFGALTVTMKLFPAVVSLHLLGGYGLLALLAWQVVRTRAPWAAGGAGVGLGPGLGSGARSRTTVFLWLALVLLLLQAALGAWVSSNYAVLACGAFPTCQGQWWPQQDWGAAWTLWRPLGLMPDGSAMSLPGLTAIHMAHRLGAGVLTLVLGLSAWLLARGPGTRRLGLALALLLGGQWVSGVGNVVWDAPLLSSLLHTAFAGAMVVVLVLALALPGATRVYEARMVLSGGVA